MPIANGGAKGETLYLGVYCDDIVAVYGRSDKGSVYSNFHDHLHTKWKAEDEGELNDILNVRVTRVGSDVILDQVAYIDAMVERFMPASKLGSFKKYAPPFSPYFVRNIDAALALPLASSPGYVPPDVVLLAAYQSIVGALLYCSTVTRPDISYSVSMLCRCMSRPTPALLEEAYHVLGYLHHHREVGLRYSAAPSEPWGHTDSNWATRRSTSGHTFHWQGCTIDWGSTQQTLIALSSCEAEIMACSEAAKAVAYAAYYRYLLEELGFLPPGSTSLSVDNKAGIDLAYNPEHHKRTKHIERRHFFIREMIEALKIWVPYIKSSDNLADFFTKSLPTRDFFRLRNLIMNVV